MWEYVDSTLFDKVLYEHVLKKQKPPTQPVEKPKPPNQPSPPPQTMSNPAVAHTADGPSPELSATEEGGSLKSIKEVLDSIDNPKDFSHTKEVLDDKKSKTARTFQDSLLSERNNSSSLHLQMSDVTEDSNNDDLSSFENGQRFDEDSA